MTRHVTVMVWDLAGQPDPPGASWYEDGPTVCVMCGRQIDRSAPTAKAIGNNFTDHYLYRRPDSDRICAACIWCCSGKPPATLRMWSIVAAPGQNLAPSQPKAWLKDTPGLCLTSRADPAPVADILLDPPPGEWTATVATSGQKHVLPYGRVNVGAGRWTVRMESTDVTAGPAEWRLVLGHVAALRAARHGAEQVRQGAPDMRAVKTPADLRVWRALAEPLTPYLRSPLIDLALWCCTKTTTEMYAHLKETDCA